MCERNLESCLRYSGKPKCNFTGKMCDEDHVKKCEDYKSNEGLYECPHCNRKGLKLFEYNNGDSIWECLHCGAELWYCPTLEEMLQRCEEIKKRAARYKKKENCQLDPQKKRIPEFVGNQSS